MKNLGDLVNEINHFEKVISNMDNPTGIDAQNACMLFGNYLKSQFQEIKKQNQLNTYTQLSKEDILLLEQYIDEPHSQWAQYLFKHCARLAKLLNTKTNTMH